MGAFLSTTIFGVLISVMGIINMKGNVSTLHWYHRKRVAEVDKKPMGRLVGLGTIIIGVAFIVFAAFALVATLTTNHVFFTIGGIELIVGLIIGILISFYAMFKYNKGIF